MKVLNSTDDPIKYSQNIEKIVQDFLYSFFDSYNLIEIEFLGLI